MDKRFLYFDDIRPAFSHAGFKAPMDVNRICSKMVSEPIDLTFVDENCNNIFYKIRQWLKVRKIISTLPRDKVLFLTMPTFYAVQRSFNVIKKRGMKIIGLIHDLQGLRIGKHAELNREIKKINYMNVIISHNQFFTKKLIELKIDAAKIIEIELFDYLCDKPNIPNIRKGIAFAGNLPKSQFLRNLPNSLLDCGLNLYGTPFKEAVDERVVFRGSFDSESIVDEVAKCKYGLIWDGDSPDACTGLMGEYMRINNPHKLSLYIAAELPVITWSQAAIADFVKKNNIGICVDSLSEVSDRLKNISHEEYCAMQYNLSILGEKVRNGYFLKTALNKALDILDKKY